MFSFGLSSTFVITYSGPSAPTSARASSRILRSAAVVLVRVAVV